MELGMGTARRVLAIPDPGSIGLDSVTLLGPNGKRNSDLLAFHVQPPEELPFAAEVARARVWVAGEEIRVRLIRAQVDDQVVRIVGDRIVDGRGMDALRRVVSGQHD